MLKDFKVLNNTFDVKSYDKVFAELENCFNENDFDLSKYPKKINLGGVDFPLSYMKAKDTRTIYVFFGDEEKKVKLSFYKNEKIDYFSHTLTIENINHNKIYDLKSIYLTKNLQEYKLEIDFYNYEKSNIENEFEYKRPLKISIEKKKQEEDIKYKNRTISIKSGSLERNVIIKNRKADFDALSDKILDFMSDRDIEKLHLFKASLKENTYSSRFYKTDFELEKNLLIERLENIQEQNFIKKALNPLLDNKMNDSIFDINSYVYVNDSFHNKEDPRIVLKVGHYGNGFEHKTFIKVKENFVEYEVESKKVEGYRIKPDKILRSIIINRKNMDLEGYKNLHFVRLQELNSQIEYTTRTPNHIESHNIFSFTNKKSEIAYNKLINDIIDKYNLEPKTLREVAYPTGEVGEILDMLALENDIPYIHDLKEPFENLNFNLEIIENKLENKKNKKLEIKC